jgi:hypothetical protein
MGRGFPRVCTVLAIHYTVMVLHVPSGEETFDNGLFCLVIEDLLLVLWYCLGRCVPGDRKAGSAGTGGIGSCRVSWPLVSVDKRRMTASIERSSRLLHL